MFLEPVLITKCSVTTDTKGNIIRPQWVSACYIPHICQ